MNTIYKIHIVDTDTKRQGFAQGAQGIDFQTDRQADAEHEAARRQQLLGSAFQVCAVSVPSPQSNSGDGQ